MGNGQCQDGIQFVVVDYQEAFVTLEGHEEKCASEVAVEDSSSFISKLHKTIFVCI